MLSAWGVSFARWRPPRSLLASLALILLGLVAASPLAAVDHPWSADANDHLYRLVEFDALLRQGVLYPRWAPDLAYGYGFPLFNYYPPLSYYLGALAHALAPDYLNALRLAFAAALIAASTGAFQLASQAFGDAAGWVAAGAYVFSPYLVLNALQRGNLPETLAMGLAPWCLLGFLRLAQRPQPRRLLLPALATAAVGLTHTLSFVLLFGLACSFGVFLLWTPPAAVDAGHAPHRARLAAYLALALVLALLLASAYWLPAFAELRYVQSVRLTPPAGYDYRANFDRLADLLTWPRRPDPLLLNEHLPYSLALPGFALAMLTLLPHGKPLPRRLVAFFWLGVLVPAVLMAPSAVGIWDRVGVLRVLQFPWRLLGPASLSLAVLAGAGLTRAALPRAVAHWLVGGVVLVLGVWVLTWTFVPDGDLPLPAQVDTSALTGYELAAGHIGLTSNADYLPLAVSQMPAPHAKGEFMARDGLPIGSRLELLQSLPYVTEWQVSLPAPGHLVFYQFIFPGWRADLDGHPIPVGVQPPFGLIALDLPSGDHRLTIQLEPTSLERLATALTILAGAVCLLLVFLPWRKTVTTATLPAATLQPGPVLLAAILVLGLRVSLQNRTTIFYGTRLRAEGLVGTALPTVVNFDDKLRLLGADVGSTRIVSGSDLTFTLYWQAIQRLSVYYSITTVLLDDHGARVAQDDSEHPGQVWTTTWPTDRYVADAHVMHLPAGLPPGFYSLQVGVYQRDNLRPVRVQESPANAGALLWPLAQVQVVRPVTPPNPADLPIDVRLSPPTQLDGLELLGYSRLPTSARVGDLIPLQFFWRAHSGGLEDWRTEILLGADATLFPISGNESYPTTIWAAGEIVRATYQVPVSVLLPEGAAAVVVRLVTKDGTRQLQALPLGTIQMTIPPHTDHVPPMAHRLQAQFGPAIELLGYDVAQSAAGLDLTLYWRSLAPADANYTVFVHVLDQAGNLSAQTDRPPLGGARPTHGWIPGEVLTDSVRVEWPPSLASGNYLLSIGLYDPASGARLPVGDTDSLSLTDLTIQR